MQAATNTASEPLSAKWGRFIQLRAASAARTRRGKGLAFRLQKGGWIGIYPAGPDSGLKDEEVGRCLLDSPILSVAPKRSGQAVVALREVRGWG